MQSVRYLHSLGANRRQTWRSARSKPSQLRARAPRVSSRKALRWCRYVEIPRLNTLYAVPPNASFKPKPLRSTKGMAEEACHAFGVRPHKQPSWSREMRATVATCLLVTVATVGCSQPPSSIAESYDSSATWAALNQSQTEGNFYSGMRQRLEDIEFVCTSKSEGLTGCVKQAQWERCTYSESIEFNSSGVSHYFLDKKCAV